MRIGINKLKMELLEELVKRNLKKKYRGSFLGIIWTVLNPLLMMNNHAVYEILIQERHVRLCNLNSLRQCLR